MAKYEIFADEENNAEKWWDAAHDHVGQFREAIQEIVKNGRTVTDADGRDQLLSWAKTLPGWSDGPQHAPAPLIVQEVD